MTPEYYVMFDDDEGRHFVKSEPFNNFADAEVYASGIAKSRNVKIMVEAKEVKCEFFGCGGMNVLVMGDESWRRCSHCGVL